MMLELADAYTLTDLLKQAGQLMERKDLRKFSFIFNTHLSFHLERTDARTNRILYSTCEYFQKEPQSYYNADKVIEAFNDLYTDLKFQLNRLNTSGPDALKQAAVELRGVVGTKPISYAVNANGYRYNRIVTE